MLSLSERSRRADSPSLTQGKGPAMVGKTAKTFIDAQRLAVLNSGPSGDKKQCYGDLIAHASPPVGVWKRRAL